MQHIDHSTNTGTAKDIAVTLYIIRLDEGFYDPAGGYVSHILAHPDNVKEA